MPFWDSSVLRAKSACGAERLPALCSASAAFRSSALRAHCAKIRNGKKFVRKFEDLCVPHLSMAVKCVSLPEATRRGAVDQWHCHICDDLSPLLLATTPRVRLIQVRDRS